MRTLLITIALSLLLVSAAGAAVVEGPERPVSSPTYDVAYGGQYVEAMATDGSDFLVIWNDYTSGGEGLRTSVISASGELRTVPPVRLSAGAAVNASLVWNGEAYLATWYDQTLGGVVGARLGRDGRALETPRLLIGNAVTASRALAWNGTNFLLAYRVELNRPLGALLDRNGNLIKKDIAMASGPTLPIVSSNGNRFFVFWRVSSQVPGSSAPILETFFVSRVDGNGVLLDPSPAIVGTTGAVGLTWDVAFNGQRFALASLETRPQGQGALRRFLIDPATLSSSSLPALDVAASEVRLVATGSEFVAWWIAGTQANDLSIVSRSFRADGTEGTTVTALPLGAYGLGPVVAWNGQRFGLAWMDRSLSGSDAASLGDVFGIALDASRTAVFGAQSKTALSIAAHSQQAPVVATGNGEVMAVWIESVGDELRSELRAARLARDGSPISAPIVLSTAGRVPQRAAIAFTGRDYRVAWIEREGTSYRAMTRTIGLNGVAGATLELANASDVTVASNGNITLVAWLGGSIQAARFDAVGTRIDTTPITIAQRDGLLQLASASNGADFLVAWTEGAFLCLHLCPPAPLNVYAARVMAAGGSVDAAPIAIATGTEPELAPSVASDGRDYVVVYARNFNGVSSIIARRVHREGAIGGSAIVDPDAGMFSRTAVTFTGWRFAIAWEDKSGGVRTAFLPPSLDQLTLPATIASGRAPSIAAVDPRAALVVYARPTDDATYGSTQRVFARTVVEPLRTRRVR